MDRVKLMKAMRQRIIALATGERLVFHHIPKCGGTSVGRALRMRYLVSQANIHPLHTYAVAEVLDAEEAPAETLARMHALREQLLLYLLHEDVHCVSGHIRFSSTAFDRFESQYRFVTILRDPVQRFMSHYFHSYQRHDYSRIELPLDAFVETEDARRLGATYVAYLSDLPWDADFATDAAISSACATLDRFHCVGIVEDMAGFADRLHDVLGVRPKIGHANRGAAASTDYRRRLSGELLGRIEDVCGPDMQVYRHATVAAERTP